MSLILLWYYNQGYKTTYSYSTANVKTKQLSASPTPKSSPIAYLKTDLIIENVFNIFNIWKFLLFKY